MLLILSLFINSKADEARFKARTPAYVLPGTKMMKDEDRVRCQRTWRERLESFKAAAGDPEDFGAKAYGAVQAMGFFARHTADILHTIADTIGVTDFATFLQRGFDP